jgi:tetratricopeptide (TPR) repeat protein
MVQHGVGCVLTLAILVGAGDVARAADTDARALATQARAILKTNCYRCHGQDGTNEGGFNYVADLGQLVSRRRVVPGEPAKSRLIKRILNADDPMPPAEEKVRPSTDDIALLKNWIAAGAPVAEDNSQRTVISAADTLQAMRDDLDRAAPRDRPFLRYFTLTHLHNAGQSKDELQSYRHGLSKLLNSLSWSKRIVVPRAVDAHETILRIDLRDYQWNEKTWELLLARNPYGVDFGTASAKASALATRCDLPFLRADWFVAVASRPPLYHDILQLPTSERELENLLRVDILANIRQERVVRAGFNSSGVSRNNRLIERHESGATVYWKSYDFGGNTGRQNLFAHPLGPLTPAPLPDGGDRGRGEGDGFQHDGGEIIFSLPNGLQAYLLVDGKGQRIDKGPTSIVSDPRRPDRAVENGLSCMSCHARGIIQKADQVREHVLKSPRAFTPNAVETIQALYPPADKLATVMRTDAKRFQDAVAETGAPLSVTEPIAALAARFEAELDLPLAAAESGVAAADFLKALERFPHLAKQLGPLRLSGGTVQRQVFVDAYPDLVEALKVGVPVPATNAAADRLVRQGHGLIAKNPAAALQKFTKAIDLDSKHALAYAGQGDVYRQRGELSEAVAAYTEALRLDPRSPTFFNNRGLTFHRQREHAKAINDFDAAVRLEPRFTIAYLNRGVAQHAAGELDKAIVDYTEALRIDDKSALAHNNRGYAFYEKEENDKALADFNQALKLDAKLAAAHNNRGLVRLRLKQTAAAIQDFTRAIELDPAFARAYLNRAAAFTRQGNARRADDDRKRARAIDPSLEKD